MNHIAYKLYSRRTHIHFIYDDDDDDDDDDYDYYDEIWFIRHRYKVITLLVSARKINIQIKYNNHNNNKVK